MTRYSILFSKKAEGNLRSIYRYIAKKASAAIAAEYVSGIRDECVSLCLLPNRGTEHSDVMKGLRTIGYRHSATISFVVTEDVVKILGIFYRGRNVDAQLSKLER